jgi:hypothetical protein
MVFSTYVTMEAMMTPSDKTKKILLVTGLFVLLFATTAWATSPRVSWQPAQLIPNSIAPGESREFVVTLKNAGFLPIPTQQLQIVATGNIVPFLVITQPNWPPVLKRGKTVDVRLRVVVPEGTPLLVARGEIFVQRILPNGKIKEVLFGTLPMELTFSVIPLPPDPGEAGQADLLGIDTDGNGVRDDIDRYIVFTQPDSEKKREGLKQSARSLNAYLRDREDKGKTRENGIIEDEASDCLAHVFNDDLDIAFKANDELIAQSLNTPERSRAYKRADNQMGGYVSDNGPSSERLTRQKAACVFDADSLPN